MSKSIIIQEGGIGKQLTVDKLKTDLVSGVISPGGRLQGSFNAVRAL